MDPVFFHGRGRFRVGNLVSATAYFTRDSFYQNDTTSYSAYFGSFCYYATASYNIYCFQPAGVNYTYLDPIGFLRMIKKHIYFPRIPVVLSGRKNRLGSWCFYEDAKKNGISIPI